MLYISLGIGVFALSCLLTEWLRDYTRRKGILDIPNHRSLHTVPTPRGGGMAFAVILLLCAASLIWLLPADRQLWFALLAGGGLVTAVGWLDDKYNLPSSLRFAVHGAAATLAVYLLGGLPQLDIGIGEVHLGVVGYVLAWLFIVWSINLYNFMDGIDGLASGEAVTVALVAGGFLAASGGMSLATFCWLLAAAVAGFLVWNWSPAKIFMGDGGSGLLGYLFAVLALASENRGALPILVWVLLLAVFFVDTTGTLLKRMTQGEKWYAAHRSHAYQLAVQAGYTHRQVTSTILLFDVVLAALAYLSYRLPYLILPTLAVAVTLLLGVWWTVNRVMGKGHDQTVQRRVN